MFFFLKHEINLWSLRYGPQKSIPLQNFTLRTEPCCWRSSKVSLKRLTQNLFVHLTCCGLLQQTAWMWRNVFVTDQWCDICEVLHDNTGNHMPNDSLVIAAGTLWTFRKIILSVCFWRVWSWSFIPAGFCERELVLVKSWCDTGFGLSSILQWPR